MVSEHEPASSQSAASAAKTYIHIQPTTEAPDARTVESHMRRLHGLEGEHDPSGLLGRLSDPPAVTTEWVLVSSGGDDPHVDYFGVDDPATLDALEHTLRGLFPDTYELERVDDSILPASDEETRNLAAVEFAGVPERRSDWQTRLARFETFRTDNVPVAESQTVGGMPGGDRASRPAQSLF